MGERHKPNSGDEINMLSKCCANKCLSERKLITERAQPVEDAPPSVSTATAAYVGIKPSSSAKLYTSNSDAM